MRENTAMSAFIFDIDDTMYDRLTPFRLAFEKQFGAQPDTARLRSLFHAFIRRGNEVFEDAMSQRITMEEMYVFRITQALADFGYTVSRQEALDFQAAYGWQQQHIRLSSPLTEMLERCHKAGAFLGVITNGPSAHQRQKCHALGLERWIGEDHILASGDIGINKPDPGIFQEAAKRWHLIPEKTWYVGDSYEHDIVSAAAAGWHTIWLDRNGKSGAMPPANSAETSGAAQKHSEETPGDGQNELPADFIAASEEELLDIVTALLA